MPAHMQQAIEILFTSYLMPALLLPLLWIAAAFRGGTFVMSNPGRDLARLVRSYVIVGGLLALGWLLAALDVPIESGGRPLTVIACVAFVTLQILFSALAACFTSNYASIPEGAARDSLFTRFILIVALQPLGTAAGLAVIYRLFRLVYHRALPGLEVIPEGI